MVPSPPVASQLRQLIYYHLDNNLSKNALFLAQRLIAYDPRSGEAAYLLSLCQLQSGFTKAAYDTSRQHALRGSHLGCGYVFAQACLELGRSVDGLAALDKCGLLWQNRNTWNQHNESRRQHLPDAAAVLCLKGKLWKAHKSMDRAVECWATALKLNPFLWDAFMGLCESGAKVSVPTIYRLSPEMANMVQIAAQKVDHAQAVSEKPLSTQSNTVSDPFVTTQKSSSAGNHNSVLYEKLNNSKVSVSTVNTVLDEDAMNTPSMVADLDDSVLQNTRDRHWEAPNAPMRKARSTVDINNSTSRPRIGSTRTKNRTNTNSEDPPVLHDPPPPGPPTKRTVSGQVAGTSQTNGVEPSRRSVRLLSARPTSANASSKMSSFANSLGMRDGTREIKRAKAPAIKGRMTTTSNVGRVVSGNRTKSNPSDNTEHDGKAVQTPIVRRGRD